MTFLVLKEALPSGKLCTSLTKTLSYYLLKGNQNAYGNGRKSWTKRSVYTVATNKKNPLHKCAKEKLCELVKYISDFMWKCKTKCVLLKHLVHIHVTCQGCQISVAVSSPPQKICQIYKLYLNCQHDYNTPKICFPLAILKLATLTSAPVWYSQRGAI